MPTTREEQVDVRAVVADELSRVTRLLMVLLGVVSLVGAHASLADGGGEAYLPYAVIAAPSIVSVWANLELLWRRTGHPLHQRIVVTCLVAPLPNTIVSSLAWLVAGLLGGDTIAQAEIGQYEHHWWPPDARGMQAGFLMLFGGYGIGGAMGVLVLLGLVLPVLAFIRTQEVLAGTMLRTDGAHAGRSRLALRSAFLAIPVLTIGGAGIALELPPAVTAIAVVLGVALLAATAVFATRKDR